MFVTFASKASPNPALPCPAIPYRIAFQPDPTSFIALAQKLKLTGITFPMAKAKYGWLPFQNSENKKNNQGT